MTTQEEMTKNLFRNWKYIDGIVKKLRKNKWKKVYLILSAKIDI